MLCPDCKCEMTWNGEMMGKDGEIIMLYRCPKCGIEIEEEED